MAVVNSMESPGRTTVRQLGYEKLKPEQLRVLTGIVEGRDVFPVMPTVFGKNLVCMPLLFDLILPDVELSIVVVVTPLTATQAYREVKYK